MALVALVVSATWAEEAEKVVAEKAAAPETKKQEKRGLLGLGYGYAYDGGYDIGAAGHGHGLEYSPIGYGSPHHETHSEKVVTVYKNVPVPYPVDRHVPYPVEKHVPYPVKVS